MRRYSLVLVLMSLVYGGIFGYNLSDYPYKSPYDSIFQEMSDVMVISNALYDKDTDIVFSALRRAGELKIVDVKQRVLSIIGEAGPIANQGKVRQATEYKRVFDMGVLVVGKIGSTNEASIIVAYLPEQKNALSQLCILQALRELPKSKAVIEHLTKFSQTVDNSTDARVAKALVDAFVSSGEKSVINTLIGLKYQVPQAIRYYIDEAVRKMQKGSN